MFKSGLNFILLIENEIKSQTIHLQQKIRWNFININDLIIFGDIAGGKNYQNFTFTDLMREISLQIYGKTNGNLVSSFTDF